ncbi:Uncharacterized protein TCM_006490 [Theobroma cacao]|uniref:Uncharacterized protein n=1 Tax=Theobroma cacao TaxID=3641 RepID=A0A061DZH4_THECC|nr:Uncharacterized protein TCM_006490 [Theobroma cacao]
MRECLHELQSSIRRKRGGELGKYLNSRKVVKRAVRTVLKNLKRMENKCTIYSFNKADETVAIDTVNVLREVESVNIRVFESLLPFISRTRFRFKAKEQVVYGFQA